MIPTITLSIRELINEDLDALLELYQHLHDTDFPLPERKQVETVWKEALANTSIRYFGCFVDHQLASSCTVTVIPDLTRACRPYAVIENVVTHREFRRHGYGNAVLQTALNFAWDRNCYKVMLMTGRLEETTFRFYESVGFKRDRKQAFVAKQDAQ